VDDPEDVGTPAEVPTTCARACVYVCVCACVDAATATIATPGTTTVHVPV
jgi:hypothetical protein